MKNVLLISNRKIHETGGRAEKFKTRKKLLNKHGWNVIIGYVNPKIRSLPYFLLKNFSTTLRKKIDVINSVSNPPHPQIIGGILSNITGIPWLAEFRDPMVTNPDIEPNSFQYRYRKIIEKFVVKNSDMIVWDDGIQLPDDYFEKNYHSLSSNKWFKLPPLGFEKQKFSKSSIEEYDTFTITYAGSFYNGWIEPYTFLEGIKNYIEQKNSDIKIQFFGDWKKEYQNTIEKLKIEEFVETSDFIPYDDLIPKLKGSDILLYIGGNNNRNKLNIPSKIYDYMGAKTPILAMVNPSFKVANLIRNCNLGIVVPYDKPQKVVDAIHKIKTDEFKYNPKKEVFNFTQEYKNEVFSEILDLVSKKCYSDISNISKIKYISNL